MAAPAPSTTIHLKTLYQLPSDPTSTSKPPASTSDTNHNELGEIKRTTGNPVTVTVSNKRSQNDGDLVQKKIRRAERFGMPVQLSEQEKQNSRAQRFGTVPSSQGSDATKKAQELKLKARAERFGIKQSMSTDENEKKKSRLARFASPEEQKKKARALRFSGTQVNGSSNVEVKTAIVGKADGKA